VETEVFEAQNLIRTQPTGYIQTLNYWVTKFKNDQVTLEYAKDHSIRMKEGIGAWQNAAFELRS
jgi:hypothetical protein